MSDQWGPFEPIDNEEQTPTTELNVEMLQREVGQRFPFYDMRIIDPKTIVFFCRIDEKSLEQDFSSLRRTLKTKGYLPMLRHEKGEDLIYVVPKPEGKTRSIWINIGLLIATIFSTAIAGSVHWGAAGWNILSPAYLFDGFLFFSVPLLCILGVHEMGHFFASKKHDLEASLPFFIPAPIIFGTFGAFISTREPIPDRRALLDVGLAGPLCGFLVAIPVSILGFYFMQQAPLPVVAEGGWEINFPLLLQWLSAPFGIPDQAVIHPTAFAGWAGLFVTAINLFPAGQLDGGHVSRALLKGYHKYVSWGIVGLLFILGLFFWSGWLFFSFLILFLLGTQHAPPLNEVTPLDTKRKILGIIALLIFIISFTPIPIQP